VRLPQLTVSLLSVCLAFTGCDLLTPSDPPPLPANAQVFRAPPDYHKWWGLTERCSRLTGSYDRIRWYVVPDADSFPTADGEKVGYWSRTGDGARIIIAGRYLGSELVVRHEMLHALLNRGGHPAEYFVQRCGLTWESWSPTNP